MDKPRPLPRDTDYYSIDNRKEPISDEQAFNDIANATMRLRAAFIRAGFEPPKAIELGSHKDGYRMRHILPRDMIIAMPSEARDPNETDVVFNIMGVEFRYPAHYRRTRRGTEIL